MKARLTKFTYWLISATISLLGFSACAATSKATKTDTPEVDEVERPIDDMEVMYGSPTWGYQADGRVMDEECKPIKGIRIEVKLMRENNPLETKIIHSDKNGKFQTPAHEDNPIISLSVVDEDGRKRGGDFAPTEIDLTTMKPVFDQSIQDEWYWGTNKYSNLQIKLTKKETNNE